MAEQKFLTIREASLILGVSEKEVIELAENGSLPAYKIGGVFLRFKREQLEEYKKKTWALTHKHKEKRKTSLRQLIRDFFYYNDFYILAVLIIIIILLIIFRGY